MDATDLPSGRYFYKLHVGHESIVNKMTLMK
jgi:hypothetical protein